MKRAGVVAALLLVGCADTDPYLRPGAWQPTGANSLNLAAMVSNKRDLLRGHGDTGSSAAEAVPGINRLWSGKLTPLPDSSSQAGPSGPAQAAPIVGAN